MSTQIHSPPIVVNSQPRLQGESDHRIANSLAVIGGLVRLRAKAFTPSIVDPQTFLLEIADRIDTVAQLHRLIAHTDTGTVSLSDYLHEICTRLASALSAAPPLVSLSCAPDNIVPFRLALPLGLITAELFSNSLKYAHPAGLPVRISLTCDRSATGELAIVYEDDGVGFPEGFDLLHDGHLGMRFIRSLSEQVRATPQWLSDPLGIRFEMQVPAQSETALR